MTSVITSGVIDPLRAARHARGHRNPGGALHSGSGPTASTNVPYGG